MKKFLLIVMLSLVTLLCGCESDEIVEPTYTLDVYSCMASIAVEPSQRDMNLTYYYSNSDEIALYYTRSWKDGVISCKRFFINPEIYNLQKSLYPFAEFDDEFLTIEIEEFMVVPDMNAHWDSLESSGVYTVIK